MLGWPWSGVMRSMPTRSAVAAKLPSVRSVEGRIACSAMIDSAIGVLYPWRTGRTRTQSRRFLQALQSSSAKAPEPVFDAPSGPTPEHPIPGAGQDCQAELGGAPRCLAFQDCSLAGPVMASLPRRFPASVRGSSMNASVVTGPPSASTAALPRTCGIRSDPARHLCAFPCTEAHFGLSR